MHLDTMHAHNSARADTLTWEANSKTWESNSNIHCRSYRSGLDRQTTAPRPYDLAHYDSTTANQDRT